MRQRRKAPPLSLANGARPWYHRRMSEPWSAYNRDVWDGYVERGIEWTRPVAPEVIAAARRGEFSLGLIENWPIPADWWPPHLPGCDVLCLASGGGQQGPVLAAVGANVTVFDASPRQLAQDRLVAEREGLPLRTIQGDMRDLSALADASFDLIVHPISNCFCPDVLPVWRECHRVLRPGGVLLAGFTNPCVYVLDFFRIDDAGVLEVRHRLPYADVTHLTPAELERLRREGTAVEWSHSFDEQIGGQLAAGFVITGFKEGRCSHLEAQYMPTQFATRAVKPWQPQERPPCPTSTPSPSTR